LKPSSTLPNGPTNPLSKSNNRSLRRNQGDSGVIAQDATAEGVDAQLTQ
jgi:hypothetical protein